MCDNQSFLKAVNRWIGEGGKATLVGAPRYYETGLQQGQYPFLVKVKAQRGEPVNEGADVLADKAISDPKVGKEWCQRMNRASSRGKHRAARQGK